MIDKRAIEKAIEGGWKYQGNPVRIAFHGDVYYAHEGMDFRLFNEKIALDPSFWQALGRGLGNKDEMRCGQKHCTTTQCEYAGYKDPHQMYERFCDAVWNGVNLELWWNELLKGENE